MKKYVSFALIGASFLALAACSSKEKDADYSYEQKAPYSDERTVGEGVTHKGDNVFKSKQSK